MAGDDEVRVARAAFARREWATARDHFHAARSQRADPLITEDLAQLAAACWWLGRIEENLEFNEQVHHHRLAAGDAPGAALTAVEIGFCEVVRGHREVGAGWLARARRILADTPDAAEHGYLLAIDAGVAFDTDDTATADRLARKVLDLGDHHRDPTLQAQGLFLCGKAAIRRGRVDEGVRFLDEAMLPVQAGRVVPEWTGTLYCSMMQLCYELGDPRRAEHWTAVTERWCQGFAPATLFTGICRVHRVQLMQIHGDWTGALRQAQSAASELVGIDVVVAAEAHYRMAEVYRLRGDLDASEQSYRRAHELGRDPLPGIALLHLERGHRQVAHSILDAALTATRDPLARAPLLAALIAVDLAGEIGGRTDRWIDELARIADDHASPLWQAEACRWRGAALVARGRSAPALAVLRDALPRWQQIGAPLEVARIRLDLAAALDALGDHATANRELTSAEAVFESLGARRDLNRLRADRERRSTPDGLSAREVEVVAAVARGASNREAAKRLGISERTVARHLANVYLKTGVASRTAAVAWARERALI